MPRQGIKDIPEICASLGMQDIIITPGSRNAPLIISFTQNKKLRALSITDERSAGYFAIGMAQASGKPVGLACTSGTGALNFMPAIAEAFYQNLPLIVFTADRPAEWIDQADGQTIRQKDVFRNHVKQSFNLPVETSNENDLWYANRIISQAMGISLQSPAGPVHINVPLREPLYQPLPANSNPKIIETVFPQQKISEDKLKDLSKEWNSCQKKLIVAGFMNPDEPLNAVLDKYARRTDTVVIAENLSNLYNPDFIYAPERFFASLNDPEKENYKPDILITIGISVVSKRIKQYLRAFSPSHHWHVDENNTFIDTYKSLTRNLPVKPSCFFEDLFDLIEQPSDKPGFYDLYKEKERLALSKHKQYLEKVEFSDLSVFKSILENIPANSNVHFANSTPVRYAQLFETRKDLTYFCNRGTSGIDGCISTAAGFAFASQKPTTVVAGDLAFIYDSNGLWNNYLNHNFRIIVMNNGGGNIFRLIETSPEINDIMNFFETPHKVNIELLARSFGIKYYNGNAGNSIPGQFFSEDGPALLEIKTDAATDVKIFKEYYKFLKNE